MAQDPEEIPLIEIYFLVYDICLSKVPFGLALDVRHPETPIEGTLLYRPVHSANLHGQTSIFLDAHINFKPTVDDNSHAGFLGLS